MKQSLAFILFCLGVMMFAGVGCADDIKYPDGGYDYPRKVQDSNYYYYPLKDAFSRRDSFHQAFDFITYNNFDEPNLSLRFNGQDVFRFYYEGYNGPLIIVVTKNKIIIKKGNRQMFQQRDTSILTSVEKLQLDVLRYHYPIQENDYIHDSSGKKMDDSLVKIYPQLLNPAYFKYLLLKGYNPNGNTHNYKEVVHYISLKEYRRIISFINDNGYWKLPCIINCSEVSDGDYYSLEANTKNKYKAVISDSCPDDVSNFSGICQEIIKTAGLDREIGLILKTHREE